MGATGWVNSSAGVSATGAVGTSATGVSATGVSATGVSATGVMSSMNDWILATRSVSPFSVWYLTCPLSTAKILGSWAGSLTSAPFSTLNAVLALLFFLTPISTSFSSSRIVDATPGSSSTVASGATAAALPFRPFFVTVGAPAAACAAASASVLALASAAAASAAMARLIGDT